MLRASKRGKRAKEKTKEGRQQSISGFQISHFQNEAKCKTFLAIMSFICMRIKNNFHINSFPHNFALIIIISNGNRTEWSPIRSVIIRVIKFPTSIVTPFIYGVHPPGGANYLGRFCHFHSFFLSGSQCSEGPHLRPKTHHPHHPLLDQGLKQLLIRYASW